MHYSICSHSTNDVCTFMYMKQTAPTDNFWSTHHESQGKNGSDAKHGNDVREYIDKHWQIGVQEGRLPERREALVVSVGGQSSWHVQTTLFIFASWFFHFPRRSRPETAGALV